MTLYVKFTFEYFCKMVTTLILAQTYLLKFFLKIKWNNNFGRIYLLRKNLLPI
jgi:hypothetical protein